MTCFTAQSTDADRQTIANWLSGADWSPKQFLRAVRITTTSDVVSEQTLSRWMNGGEIGRHALAGMIRFIERYPAPGSFACWEQRIAATARERMIAQDAQIQARREAVARQHEERRAALLAAERAPRERGTWFPSMRFLHRDGSAPNKPLPEIRMSRIYVTTYEVIGAGLAIADKHYDAVDSAREAHWDFAKRIGARGFRPAHDGGVRSFFFVELTRGWRKVGRDGELTEAVPYKNNARGKALVAEIGALPKAPKADDLASRLGWCPPEMAVDYKSGRIYFPTDLCVAYPVERTFIRLPRFSEDRFEPDASMLAELPESALRKAVEDHNAEAERRREADRPQVARASA